MFSRHCSSVLRATTSNGKSLGNKKNISFAKLPATSKLPGVRATSLIPQGLRVRYLASSSMDGEKVGVGVGVGIGAGRFHPLDGKDKVHV